MDLVRFLKVSSRIISDFQRKMVLLNLEINERSQFLTRCSGTESRGLGLFIAREREREREKVKERERQREKVKERDRERK